MQNKVFMDDEMKLDKNKDSFGFFSPGSGGGKIRTWAEFSTLMFFWNLTQY